MPNYIPIQDLTISASVADTDYVPMSDGSTSFAVRASTFKGYAIDAAEDIASNIAGSIVDGKTTEISMSTAAKYRNDTAVLPYDDITLYSQGHYMDASGNLVASTNHDVRVIDGHQVTKIEITMNSTVNWLPVIIVKDGNGTVQYVGKVINASYLKVIYLNPAGLPQGSKIYINDWYANYGTRAADRVSVRYLDADPRIVVGKNKFNKNDVIENVYYGYNNGSIAYQSGYVTSAIPVSAGDEVRYTAATKHVSFYDEYGQYISGVLNGLGTTAPAGAKFVIISLAGTSYLTNFVTTINDSDLTYTPYSYKFNNPVGASEGDRYHDYTEGQIHFTIPVNVETFTDTESATSGADALDVVDVPAVLILPANYSKNGKQVPLLIIFHGSGYGVSSTAWGWDAQSDNSFNAFVSNFVNAGYAVCDINGYQTGVHSTWGSPRTIQAYRKLYEYVVNNYNVSDKANLYGFSMGGVIALNFAANNSDIVKCIGIAAPVVSLYDEVYNFSSSRRSSLGESFAFDLPAGFVWSSGAQATAQENTIFANNAGKMVGFDPYKKIMTINNDSVILFPYAPIRAWHAKDDTSMPYQYTVDFVNAVRNGQGYASVRLVDSGGHGISYGTNQTITDEYVMWFDRFNQKDE